MADCSSLNPLVLRITYDELVVLADELDNKKEKKHPKKKNHDKPQEQGDKCSKNEVEKRDTTDVRKNSNRKGERRKESEKGERNDKKEAKKEKKKGAESKEKHKSSSESTVSERESVTPDNKRKQKVKCGGQIQKKIVFNDNVDEYQDSELDLRARTGGVLKLSTTPLSSEDGHSTNSAKPRGIIKLPEGFDLNSHDTAEEKEELPCTSNEVVNNGEADDVFSRNRVQSKQVNTSNTLFDPDRAERLGVQENCHVEETKNNVQINEVSENECDKVQDISTENEQKQSPVEKRLKALNRQKAQKLMKLVTQTESSLNNLLSRDVLDKAAFQKIKMLSKEIQDLYKGILMLDLAFAVQKDVDQTLWKNGFYQVIETFRKYGKLFLGYADKKEVLSQEEINSCLKEFLESAHTFYKGLLESLQKTHQFSVQDVVNQPRKAEHLGKSVKLALLSSHHILICLGDIERYQAQFQPNHNWAAIRTWYLKASKLAPKDGKPYNQLAVVAVFAKRKLDAVYYYVRSLTVSNPILTAREKLMTIYYEIQKKADRIQRSEDEKRISLEQSRHNNAKGKGRGKGWSVFGEVAKGVGLMSEHNANHGRHEVWIFLRQESYRRVMLTENGQVQEVNLTGEPISEVTNKEPSTQTAKEPPKISLQEVNKMFVLHFLCAHGFLFSRIGMERLPALQYLLMGEFHTLLEYPACSAVSRSSLLQIMAINMFAIDNTAAQDSTEPYVRVGTPQDQALNLAVDMFICLLKCCCDLLRGQNTEGDTAPQTMEGLSAPLRQFLPAVKVFADWMICHVDLWQSSSISTHRNLWESMAQFVNAVAYLDIQNVLEESGDDMVTLWEDEFLAGFKLLIKANKPLCKVSSLDYKDLAEDNLRCQVFKDFAVFLVSLESPPLEFDADTGQFCAMIKSTPVSPAKESPSVTLHLDTASSQDHEDSDDDVIIESVEEEVDSGDEMEKDLKELKAKKDALKKQVEVHKERQDKAKAVINEHISKPRLMLENYPTYLVPDTNCFVDHMNGIRAIVACQAFTLVVPLIVINELDGLKRDFQVSKYNDLQHAQYVLDNARGAVDFLEFEFSQRNPQVKAVTSKGSELDTIAFRSEDPSGRKGKGCNDDIILSCCLHYCEENFVNRLATADQPITIQRKVVLLTDDRNLRVKAYTRNVPVLTVPQFRKMARL